jgi:DeoR/GlpR family transcriptional regulator of sugar metabolism
MAGPKLYQSKAWLQEKYRTMNAAQIAALCGVTEMTITRYLEKHGIVRRRSR